MKGLEERSKQIGMDAPPYILSCSLRGYKAILIIMDIQEFEVDDLSDSVWRSAYWGEAAEMAEAVARGGDVDAVAENGMTVAMAAASNGHSECLALIIGFKADLEAKDPYGCNPLMSAAFWGNGRCLAMLLEAGVRVDATDNAGLSAAMHATSEGHADCLSLLIEAGANLSIESLSGATASSLARDGQHFDCASLIDSAIEKRALAAHVSRVAVSTLGKKRI